MQNSLAQLEALAHSRSGMEHPTEEAKQKYLKDHPGADPANHTVRDEHARRVNQVPKGTYRDVGGFHQDAAPPSVKKLLDHKIPAITRDNQDRVLKSPAMKELVDTASKLSGPELKRATEDAYRYVMSLRDRIGKIQTSKGDRDPILEKAFSQAHALWVGLDSAQKSKTKQARIENLANRLVQTYRSGS